MSSKTGMMTIMIIISLIYLFIFFPTWRLTTSFVNRHAVPLNQRPWLESSSKRKIILRFVCPQFKPIRIRTRRWSYIVSKWCFKKVAQQKPVQEQSSEGRVRACMRACAFVRSGAGVRMSMTKSKEMMLLLLYDWVYHCNVTMLQCYNVTSVQT